MMAQEELQKVQAAVEQSQRELARKKEQLLAANKEAARNLLSQIPTVSRITTRKHEFFI